MRYKDNNKKEAIYQATILLLNRDGFSSTSMSKIAKHAGVSASTIYIYFENKDDMLKKLYLDTKQKMSTQMFSDTTDSDAKTGLAKVIRNYIDYIVNNKDAFLFLQQFTNSPYMSEFDDQEASNYFMPMYQIVKSGRQEGTFKDVDNDILFAYIEPPITELAKRYFRGESSFTEERIEALIRLAWSAIKK
ncbi:TetR/AcrR family transcriptional regulator [Lactiplantibacillus plantarum]|uniref:TetR/AcrR family transcriptional regulator n=1 Tax=Lactiplantibacillus plantarum TaxID=1590 RepID=UPI001BDF1732|nr:TetR/AcrR family transcriptional regulator [Lactiplantibacillus plantarum]MDH5110720.1 TetR/AcrR family transcriptional regulator [Lactiplantibacillus plantarum]UOF04400.1 TetR/AcrR family transcriptional regulator [Lactiplantibacillus plantarum subsp. plantarum]